MNKFLKGVLSTVIIASTILTGCSNKSKVDNSWNKVKEKGEFVLGLDDQFPPMGFTDENGQITGFDIDLAKEVFKRLGVELKLQPIDWDAKEQELNSGNIDCIWNGFTINDERKKQVLFSKPYMKNRQVLVVKGDSSISSLADLSGKQIGLQAASSAADALEKSTDFKNSIKKAVEFDDNMYAFMDLEKGGVDAVLVDEIVARYYIQKQNKDYKVLDDSLASEEYGIGFRKGDTKLMEKVQETLEAMAKDGTLEKISKDWFKEDITTVGK